MNKGIITLAMVLASTVGWTSESVQDLQQEIAQLKKELQLEQQRLDQLNQEIKKLETEIGHQVASK